MGFYSRARFRALLGIVICHVLVSFWLFYYREDALISGESIANTITILNYIIIASIIAIIHVINLWYVPVISDGSCRQVISDSP